jgi:hypothetical protein
VVRRLFHVVRRELERNFEKVHSAENTILAAGVTYRSSLVAFKCAVVDLHCAFIGINGSALEVACGPPGHGEKIRKFLRTRRSNYLRR